MKQNNHNNEGRNSFVLHDGCEYEINVLWDNFEREKSKIIFEEMDKDVDLGYENVYEEHYFDYWRVEELLEQTLKAEDEIYTRWGD